MPTPSDNESRDDFMNRCIPMVQEEGTAKDPDQAVAICSSMWEEHMSSKAIDETLVMFGGAVKALGDGRIGGYLVRFSTEDDPDLEGEFFTKDTYFGDPKPVPLYGTVYYQHGMDVKLGKRKLGTATHKMDEWGIWAETQLELREAYERYLEEWARAGKLGWSSGTAGHLIERVPTGKATWIKSWPIGLDDTLTPIPAEPRNIVTPLKSWKPTILTPTLADRSSIVAREIQELLADYSGLIKSIDKPLSETKRQELMELLGLCSGWDAVRSDLQSVLTAAPSSLIGDKWIRYQMDEARKRLSEKHILGD